MISIRPRDPENDGVRPEDCKASKKLCDDSFWFNKPADEEKQKELIELCCSNIKNKCEEDEGAGFLGHTAIIVTGYIKNSKLAKNREQGKTCAKKKPETCSNIKEYELLIDLSSPPENPEDKPEKGDNADKSCANFKDIGKPVNQPGQPEVKKPGGFPMRVPIKIIPGWDGEDTECPVTIPLLHIQIPHRKRCTNRKLNKSFEQFLKDCNDTISPNIFIPMVCGTNPSSGMVLPPCSWKDFVNPNPPKSAKDYYEKDSGYLKVIGPDGQRLIRDGYVGCRDRAAALLNGDGRGPVDLEGNPLINPECANAFGISPSLGRDPKQFPSAVNCPSDDVKKICDVLTCLDNGQTGDNVGEDEDGEIIDINTSNITVSIVEKNTDNIASNCLDGERTQAHQYSSGNDIRIDIHFGVGCDEEVNEDDLYKGVTICKKKFLNCDTINSICTLKSWTKEKPTVANEICDSNNEEILQTFECLTGDDRDVKKILESEACNPNPVVFCCETPFTDDSFANKLLAVPLKDCCTRPERSIVFGTADPEVAQRDCKPKVACCMEPPTVSEGTCFYSVPTNIRSTVVWTYFFRGNVYSLSPVIQLNRNWDDPNIYNDNFKEASWLQMERALKTINISPTKVAKRLKLPQLRGGALDLDKFTVDDFKKIWEESIRSAIKSEKLKVEQKPYNFSIRNKTPVDECTDDNANAIEDPVLTLEDMQKKVPSLIVISEEESATANSYGLDLPSTPASFTASKKEYYFQKCSSNDWKFYKARTSSEASCMARLKSSQSCCDRPGDAKFIPNLVSAEVGVTTPVEVKCTMDSKTGKITCENLPDPEIPDCFIVGDGTYAAAYECERRRGKVVGVENRDTKLTQCPEGTNCSELTEPPQPQPVPDPEDTDNPLDPPTSQPNPDPDIPIDENNPPPSTECACLSINGRPTQTVQLPIVFKLDGEDYNLDSPQKLNEYLQKYSSPPFSQDGKINNTFIPAIVQSALGIDRANDSDLRFTYEMVRCDCNESSPPSPKAPQPHNDDPTPPPKGSPQQPPNEVDLNNKRAELTKLKARLNTVNDRLIIIKKNIDESSKVLEKDIAIWNSECTPIIESIPILNWFYSLSPNCNRIAMNICVNWDGEQTLPSNFPPKGTVLSGFNGGTVRPGPVAVKNKQLYNDLLVEKEQLEKDIEALEASLN